MGRKRQHRSWSTASKNRTCVRKVTDMPAESKRLRVGVASAAVALCLAGLWLANRPTRQLDLPLYEPTNGPVFYTSLEDSISPTYVHDIGVSDVSGIGFSSEDGRESRYFRYQADPSAVLKALRGLPFHIDSPSADAMARRIPFEELETQFQTLSTIEKERAAFFWNIDRRDFDAYELVRNNVVHQVLISHTTREVLHRLVRT